MQQSSSDMTRELPLADSPFHTDGRSVNGSPGSLGPLSATSSEVEDSEHARLVVAPLSDDGRTPLIHGTGQTRRQKVVAWSKLVLGVVVSSWYKILIIGAIITLIVLVSVKGFGIFGDILSWFRKHNGWAGWGAFVGMYTGMVALFLPGVVFIMGAGFVFGFWRGLLAVWVGGAVGQALAFLLARYLLKDWVEKTIKKKWKAWQYIDKAIEHDGWKLVLIMRFSPIIPYNLLNIAMATTPIPFVAFTVVSAIGIIFECAVFCYFGSMAENVSSIISGQAGPAAAFEWVMLGISIVMCVGGAVLVSYSIKRAVRRAEAHMSMQDLGREAADDAAELGVALDATFLQALQREGFARTPLEQPSALPSSPEFELRAVRSAELVSSLGLDRKSASGSSRLQQHLSGKAKLSPPPPEAEPKQRDGAQQLQQHRRQSVGIGDDEALLSDK